jgi:hypothetical protein
MGLHILTLFVSLIISENLETWSIMSNFNLKIEIDLPLYDSRRQVTASGHVVIKLINIDMRSMIRSHNKH